jgi:sec-independent protein translocase protein TatA
MFRQIGPTEILVVLGVVLLLFGGKKLPELARGSGRALRIFKTEVKALHDDDDDEVKPASVETVRAAESDKKPEQG